MPLPQVTVDIAGGGLGRVVERPDGVAGMVLSGVAVAGKLNLNTAYPIYSLKEAEDLGLDAAYDATNTTRAWRHIRDFYEQAGTGAELFIMVTAQTETLTQNVARIQDLVDASEKRLRLAAITRSPGAGYTPTLANGWDQDVDNAVAAAKTLSNDLSAAYSPVSILIEARHVGANYATLVSQRGAATGARYVSVVVGDYESGNGAFAGLVLGRLAAVPVQRSIARVRDGNINKANVFIGTVDASSISDTALGVLHDKGLIFARKYAGRNGWYFNGGENCDEATSDFAFISRTRTIEKARLIAYAALLEYLNDEVDIDPDSGKLSPAIVADIQAYVNNSLAVMEAGTSPNVTQADLSIDPNQNVLSTDKVVGTVKVIPVGLARTIEATVSYENPFNS